MKKIIVILISALLVISSVPCMADNNILVNVDGQTLVFDSQPTIVNGRTLVPLRKIFETFGYTVTWDASTDTVTAVKDDKTINLQVGNTTANVNSNQITLDVPAKNIDGRVLVPVRFVSEASGADVNWDGDKKVVTIKTNSTTANNNYTSSSTTLEALKIDNTKWNFDSTNNVYWQVGISYCATPEAQGYESMGIYIPAQYMTAKDNGDGTYTCSVNSTGTIGNYNATTAPMVFPVETPGYAAHAAPTSFNYNQVASYLKAGFIYLDAGCRGNANNRNTIVSNAQNTAPWGVADLKAAIRYVRLNASSLPGDSNKIFSFGMSGGGAQSAILGSTGDSPLYYPYLNKINAALTDTNGNTISDAVYGSMCWCPITVLDVADEAYEWMMGQYLTTGTRAEGTFTSALSDDLSKEFASYINKIGLTNDKGNILTLNESSTGIYASGSYYDYIKSIIETSFNNFLADTKFPYTPAASRGPNGGPNGGNGGPNGGNGGPNGGQGGGANGGPNAIQSNQATVTYQTIQEYIDSLNGSDTWINYNAQTNTATITSISAFVQHCKNASKNVAAFDSLTKRTPENQVFGDNTNTPAHFNATLSNLLQQNQDTYSKYSDWNASYVEDYQTYASIKDELGTSSVVRQNMYNPLYYTNKAYDGYGTSKVAPYWRIRTGISQGDTSLTTEANLALSLEKNSDVKNVDFATVWGQYHTMAERTGNSTDNFITWVNQCCLKNN